MDKLNAVVWPAIGALVYAQLKEMKAAGTDMVLMEAAVLLEAGWDAQVYGGAPILMN